MSSDVDSLKPLDRLRPSRCGWHPLTNSDEDVFPADIYADVIWQWPNETMTICNSIHIAGTGPVAWRPLPEPFVGDEKANA